MPLPEAVAITIMASQKSAPVAVTTISYITSDTATQGLLSIPAVVGQLSQIFIGSLLVNVYAKQIKAWHRAQGAEDEGAEEGRVGGGVGVEVGHGHAQGNGRDAVGRRRDGVLVQLVQRLTKRPAGGGGGGGGSVGGPGPTAMVWARRNGGVCHCCGFNNSAIMSQVVQGS